MLPYRPRIAQKVFASSRCDTAAFENFLQLPYTEVQAPFCWACSCCSVDASFYSAAKLLCLPRFPTEPIHFFVYTLLERHHCRTWRCYAAVTPIMLIFSACADQQSAHLVFGRCFLPSCMQWLACSGHIWAVVPIARQYTTTIFFRFQAEVWNGLMSSTNFAGSLSCCMLLTFCQHMCHWQYVSDFRLTCYAAG